MHNWQYLLGCSSIVFIVCLLVWGVLMMISEVRSRSIPFIPRVNYPVDRGPEYESCPYAGQDSRKCFWYVESHRKGCAHLQQDGGCLFAGE